MTATNIQQSQHLLELGLDPKTADMTIGIDYQDKERLIADKIRNIQRDLEEIGYYDLYDIDYFHVLQPAWSLSALLDVMPNNDYWEICLWQYKDQRWQCVFDDVEFSNGETKAFVADEPITAAYEMVCWLLENNLIKKGDNDESKS